MTRYEALRAARHHFQSEQAMADALGVSQPTIWRWLNQSKQLPAEYVLLAEAATGVSRHDLRPDIYPRETMVDRQVGQRFEGVDRHAGSSSVRANASTPRAVTPSCEASSEHFTRADAA